MSEKSEMEKELEGRAELNKIRHTELDALIDELDQSRQKLKGTWWMQRTPGAKATTFLDAMLKRKQEYLNSGGAAGFLTEKMVDQIRKAKKYLEAEPVKQGDKLKVLVNKVETRRSSRGVPYKVIKARDKHSRPVTINVPERFEVEEGSVIEASVEERPPYGIVCTVPYWDEEIFEAVKVIRPGNLG